MKTLLFVVPLFVAVLFVVIALWARGKNSEPNSDGRPLHQAEFDIEIQHRNYRKAAKALFFGTLPEPFSTVGKWLAIVAIIGALAFLCLLLVLLYMR